MTQKTLVITIFSVLIVGSCKQHSSNNAVNGNNEVQPTTVNLSVSNKIDRHPDTINVKQDVIKEWTFNKEKIYLFSSKISDDFYNYGYLKIEDVESGKFIKIPKKDSPYTGLEKIVIKYPFFTIEQSYREGEYTNYEYVTLKKEKESVYLYKYAVDYTSTQNLDEDVPGLRLDRKAFGMIKIENITSDFLMSLKN